VTRRVVRTEVVLVVFSVAFDVFSVRRYKAVRRGRVSERRNVYRRRSKHIRQRDVDDRRCTSHSWWEEEVTAVGGLLNISAPWRGRSTEEGVCCVFSHNEPSRSLRSWEPTAVKSPFLRDRRGLLTYICSSFTISFHFPRGCGGSQRQNFHIFMYVEAFWFRHCCFIARHGRARLGRVLCRK